MESGGFFGKICLVTGGASGIGQATCRLLAKLRASVIVADVNIKMAEETKQDLPNQSDNHTCFQVDVSSLQSVKSLAEQIMKHYNKPPTVIIHSAGVQTKPQDTTECSEESWNKIIDVNLKGTFFINQVFIKLLKDSSMKGNFVNIASIAKEGFAQMTAYSASKAGVEGITKSLAKEFGPDGFRFNTIAPGVTRTPFLQCISEEVIQKHLQMCSMKRAGMPEEIATVCVFLTAEASSYVNGITIEVSGGKACF
jgi:17beta-estradiol 17-dehydrogenase/3alpha(17beta)-hydroxysteroid dehydrogenase (NAD+)